MKKTQDLTNDELDLLMCVGKREGEILYFLLAYNRYYDNGMSEDRLLKILEKKKLIRFKEIYVLGGAQKTPVLTKKGKEIYNNLSLIEKL